MPAEHCRQWDASRCHRQVAEGQARVHQASHRCRRKPLAKGCRRSIPQRPSTRQPTQGKQLRVGTRSARARGSPGDARAAPQKTGRVEHRTDPLARAASTSNLAKDGLLYTSTWHAHAPSRPLKLVSAWTLRWGRGAPSSAELPIPTLHVLAPFACCPDTRLAPSARTHWSGAGTRSPKGSPLGVLAFH